MKKSKLGVRFTIFVFGFFAAWLHAADSPSTALQLTPQDALETHGLSVFVFHNSYHGVFGDEKMSGVEIVLHDERVATNGELPQPTRKSIGTKCPRWNQTAFTRVCLTTAGHLPRTSPR